MRIATWNVNFLRSRIDRVEALLQRHDIDVLALQETKAREGQLPLIDFVLGSPSLTQRVTHAFIDREERAGQGSSDHAPVIVDLGPAAG